MVVKAKVVKKIVDVRANLTKPKTKPKTAKPLILDKTQSKPEWRELNLKELQHIFNKDSQAEYDAAAKYFHNNEHKKEKALYPEPPANKQDVFWLILEKLNDLTRDLSYINSVNEDLIARIFNEPPSCSESTAKDVPQPSGAVNLINQAFLELVIQVNRAESIKNRLAALA